MKRVRGWKPAAADRRSDDVYSDNITIVITIVIIIVIIIERARVYMHTPLSFESALHGVRLSVVEVQIAHGKREPRRRTCAGEACDDNGRRWRDSVQFPTPPRRNDTSETNQ